MRIAVFLVTLTLASPAVHAQSTFGKVLKREEIKTVVTSVLDHKVNVYNERAKEMDSPMLSYDAGVVEDATGRIAETRVSDELTPASAVNKLRAGFGVFVDGLVEFARDQAKNAAIRLNKELFERYMKKARDLQRCGEIPCNQPPCCHNCAPPPCATKAPGASALPSRRPFDGAAFDSNETGKWNLSFRKVGYLASGQFEFSRFGSGRCVPSSEIFYRPRVNTRIRPCVPCLVDMMGYHGWWI
jgi:hypothetical protein